MLCVFFCMCVCALPVRAPRALLLNACVQLLNAFARLLRREKDPCGEMKSFVFQADGGRSDLNPDSNQRTFTHKHAASSGKQLPESRHTCTRFGTTRW